jgi:hypothetical protein
VPSDMAPPPPPPPTHTHTHQFPPACASITACYQLGCTSCSNAMSVMSVNIEWIKRLLAIGMVISGKSGGCIGEWMHSRW